MTVLPQHQRQLRLVDDFSICGLRKRHIEWCRSAFPGPLARREVVIEDRHVPWARFTPAYKMGRWSGELKHLASNSEYHIGFFTIMWGHEIREAEGMQKAMSAASDTFTKPGLLEQAHSVQRAFAEPGADGHALVQRLRELIAEESEYKFEQMVSEFPIAITIPKDGKSKKMRLGGGGDPMPIFEEVEAWLKNHVPADQYVAFSDLAAFKYKDCYFNVYFKDKNWATYFKVSFVF